LQEIDIVVVLKDKIPLVASNQRGVTEQSSDRAMLPWGGWGTANLVSPHKTQEERDE
jgi:hypothetical protein